VKLSTGPCREGCEALRMILIVCSLDVWLCAPETSMQSEIPIATKILIVIPSAVLSFGLPVRTSKD
jgi:hypothetical protein